MALNAAFLMVEPGRLSVTAPRARNRRATQTLALWDEGAGPHRSSLDFRYTRPFPLRYLSLRRGVEILFSEGTAVTHLDRPLRADGLRRGDEGLGRLYGQATGRSDGLT